MMEELYRYAVDKGLAARSGFKYKSPKAYVMLSDTGEFQGIRVREKGAEQTYAPDIGAAANGTRYCNFLIEKAKITLGIVEDADKDRNIPVKHDFYLSMLDSGAEYEPKFSVVASVLRSDNTCRGIVEALLQHKLKSGDVIGFEIDTEPLEKSTLWLDWWSDYRRMFSAQSADDQARCFISGALTTPLATVPKVSGLFSVGGHTSGDAFLCFDKDAFQSYGFEQSANAAVSEEAMTCVNAALTELLNKAPVFGGAKQVHWYQGDNSDAADIHDSLFDGIWANDGAEFSLTEDEDLTEKERLALESVKKLFSSIRQGERPAEFSAKYYILPISGAGGRMMVRGWYTGSYEELYRSIDQWFSDLRIISPSGKKVTDAPKLNALCTRLVKPGGDPSKIWDRVNDELPNLSGRLMDAIIRNAPLPDEVAIRALRYIRSQMFADSDDSSKASTIQNETLAFQLLKAWHIRRGRQRGDSMLMGENLNTSPHSPAYVCGQLLAVYGSIQKEAMPEVGTGVIERYYTAASTTPAFVLGKLSQMSVHHLSKLEQDRPGLAAYFRKQLQSVASQIDASQLPKALSLKQQAEFALGFYHQKANRNNKGENENGD